MTAMIESPTIAKPPQMRRQMANSIMRPTISLIGNLPAIEIPGCRETNVAFALDSVAGAPHNTNHGSLMFKTLFLKAHRWIALLFALPLVVVAVTGFVLSFEPLIETFSVKPSSLSSDKLAGLVAKYDPGAKARALSIDARRNILTLEGVGSPGFIDVDLNSGTETQADSALSDFFSTTRRLHRSLIFGMNWLVAASSYAMLTLAALGLFMGFSRLRNSLSGWHKGIAWCLLPLVVLSPLTGLMLTFDGGAPRTPGGQPRSTPVTVLEATKLVAAQVDPGSILSIGVRGGRTLARVAANGETVAYAVTKDGIMALPRNWPRSLHVGSGLWTGALNVLASLGILLLLFTGVAIWTKRTLRMRANRSARKKAVSAQTAA